MEFDDQTVVVTGAAGNLGRAVAAAFAARGAKLVLVGRKREALEALYGADTPRQLLVAADLLAPTQVDAVVRAALAQFGRIDVLCNVAGAFRMGTPVHATTDADFDAMFDANARSMLHTSRAVVPSMLAQRRGKIVNVAALSALRGVPMMGAYGAAKDVVIRLTEAMAGELRAQGINVNCVLPGVIDTPENRAAMPDADTKGWVAPEALADVMLFLAGEGARAIHGACVPVAGLS